MNVKLLNATPDPEETVCTAARNDYRQDGVIGYTFEEIMDAVDPKDYHLEALAADHGINQWDAVREDDELALEAKKRTLIDKLVSDGHYGPFEHPQATIALEDVTRVAMAQITRHRHFTFDVMSLRYVQPEAETLADRFDIPPEVRGGDAVTREGVHDFDEEWVVGQFDSAYYEAMDRYERLLAEGVPQEEARKVLPMGTKVNIVMSGNARAWMHLLNIRGKANVQGEARRLADALMDELKGWMPYTFETFDEDVLPLKLNP